MLFVINGVLPRVQAGDQKVFLSGFVLMDKFISLQSQMMNLYDYALHHSLFVINKHPCHHFKIFMA